MLGKQVSQLVAFTCVTAPCQRLDVKLYELIARKHLHGEGHALGDASPGVVEHTASQGHKVYLGLAAVAGLLGRDPQRAVVLRHEHGLGDPLMKFLRLRILGAVQVALQRHRRSVDEVHFVRLRGKFTFVWREAARGYPSHHKRAQCAEVAHEGVQRLVLFHRIRELRQLQVAIHDLESGASLLGCLQNFVESVDTVCTTVASSIVEQELRHCWVCSELPTRSAGVVELVIFNAINDPVVARVLDTVQLRGKYEVSAHVLSLLDFGHDL
mmetsp:Transcript_67038/g.187181  ORF Transcript_67038/g.187181 Transcript_67038/m.187181 type:complete len:269 (+) Transcript_67038:252-1058(+)